MADEEPTEELAPPPPEPTPIDEALDCFARGEYEKTVYELTLLLQPHEDDQPELVEGEEPPPKPEPQASWWSLRAKALFYMYELERARSDFAKAAEMGESSVETSLMIAEINRRLGDAEAALEAAAKAKGDDKTDTQVALALALAAQVKLDKGSVDAAKREADRAIAKDPNCAAAHAVRGKCLLKKGYEADGLDSLTKAVELEPENVRLRLDRARANSTACRFGPAATDAVGALKANHRDPEVLALIAELNAESKARLGSLRQTMAVCKV